MVSAETACEIAHKALPRKRPRCGGREHANQGQRPVRGRRVRSGQGQFHASSPAAQHPFKEQMQLQTAQAGENMRKCRPRWPIASLTSGEFSKHCSHWTTGSIQHNCPNYVIGFATCQDWLEVVWALLNELRILESALLVSTSVRPRGTDRRFQTIWPNTLRQAPTPASRTAA
jgi:hypothetical protein